jgi:RNA polymerase sigma factor (sigma-70 family)
MAASFADSGAALRALIETHRERIVGVVRREGRRLLRFEPIEDAVQGVVARALAAREFESRSDGEFLAWIAHVTRNHVSDRLDYWYALRRRAGKVLRLGDGGSGAAGGGSASGSAGAGGSASGGSWSWLAASQTGPSTFADRREAIETAMRVLPALSERDQQLVRWTVDGDTVEEIAARLGVGYEAAGKARQRALERFRSAFRVVFERKLG